MNKNIEFLDYIYQNAEMGVNGINQIVDRVDNASLANLMEEQKEEYDTILNEAKEIYKKYGKEEKELGKITKITSYMMTEMMMMSKKGENNAIAKMMIEGSNKGIIEITEKINHYDDADEEIVSLAKKLLATEQHNLDELKKYL
ncbi:MAG: hypothetical protein IJN03_01505 [Bacilli bacterium]|nr:hypothetical protein [Bacilli bacterium]